MLLSDLSVRRPVVAAVTAALRVLAVAQKKFGIALDFTPIEWASCDYWAKHGEMMPPDTISRRRVLSGDRGSRFWVSLTSVGARLVMVWAMMRLPGRPKAAR